eukprot:4554023-Pyramimonas_sp.AAC.1
MTFCSGRGRGVSRPHGRRALGKGGWAGALPLLATDKGDRVDLRTAAPVNVRDLARAAGARRLWGAWASRNNPADLAMDPKEPIDSWSAPKEESDEDRPEEEVSLDRRVGFPVMRKRPCYVLL